MLALFKRCYAPAFTPMGAIAWQRIALPDAGGVLDQDAWLMDALDYVAQVHNKISSDRAIDAPKKKAVARG